nr:hypothetical protein GCM10017611_32710 [Rhodococcus wratislaviensis]
MTISAFRTTRGAPVSSAKNSAGAPCTRQFLVTLTVQTTKINPTPRPATRSATSLTNTHPMLGTPSDAQHESGQCVRTREQGRRGTGTVRCPTVLACVIAGAAEGGVRVVEMPVSGV